MNVFVDADACPVKNEVYKVAERHRAHVYVVSNSWLQVPREPGIEQVVVNEGPDEADNWIAERCDDQSVVVTADILLAERCLAKSAIVLNPNGTPFTAASIGSAVATRALMEQLRSTGDQFGGAPPFSKRDRSTFLQALHEALVKLSKVTKP